MVQITDTACTLTFADLTNHHAHIVSACRQTIFQNSKIEAQSMTVQEQYLQNQIETKIRSFSFSVSRFLLERQTERENTTGGEEYLQNQI